MIRILFLILSGAFLAAPTTAHPHEVIWRGNPFGFDPQLPLDLSATGDSESIFVSPVSGEDCTVAVTLDMQTSTLVNAQIVVTPSLEVEIEVKVLRPPNGSSETATISGEWHATGLTSEGMKDTLNCDAILPNPFSVEIVVSQPLDGSQLTSDNYTDDATDGDPINLFTGELTMEEEADFDLGGPMPLKFCRYYASGLTRDSQVENALGPNWACNFDWRAFRSATQVNLLSWKGRRIQFQRTGNNWQLSGTRVIPYQLQDSGADVILTDPLEEHFYTFDSNGLLTSISDGRGHSHTLSYNGGILQQVSDGLGRVLMLSHDAFHQLASVTDGLRTVRFSYNGSYLGSVTDPMTNTTSYSYDAANSIAGLLTAKTLPRGNTPLTQAYDNAGRVIRQTTADKHVRSFAYQTNGVATVADDSDPPRFFLHNGAGQLMSFTDETGSTASVLSDARGEPASIADRVGNHVGIAWHVPSGKPAAITNANGLVTLFEYAARVVGSITNYDLTQITFYDGSRELFTYDANGNVLTHTDRATNIWRFAYTSQGQFLAVTNPAGGVLSQTFNSDGTEASRTDFETGTTSFAYDSRKNVSAVTNADGSVRRFVYDALDRVVSLTDERTNTFRFSYDPNGNLSTITDPAGAITHLGYDAMDRLVQHIDRAGARATAAFDQEGFLSFLTNRNGFVAGFQRDVAHRLTRITDPAGLYWDYGYDHEGGLISNTDPLGRTSTRGFDPLRYPVVETNQLGQIRHFNRDVMGRIAQFVDPMLRTNSFAYESRGLIASATQPLVGTARFQYNNLGLLSAVQDLNGRNWTFAYSPWGRLTGMTDPLNRSTTMSYDSRGHVQRTSFPDGTTCTNSYDGANNLTRVQYSAGPDLTFTFDSLNRLQSADNLSLAYDAEGRVTSTTSSGVNFNAAHDADGRVTNVTYNAALTVTYLYDSRDRLTRVRDSLTGAQVDFTYDDAGQLATITRANGVNGTYTRDAAGRLTRIQEGSLIDLQYTLNSADEVTTASIVAPIDPAGFITQGLPNFAYDDAHQITSPGFAFDARGRQTAAPGHSFSWDGASRLVGIDTVSLAYNGLNDLVTRVQGGVTTRYFYNYALGLHPIVAEKNETTGQFTRYYVWSPEGRLLYLIDAANGNAVRYFHFDRNGSTLALTDSTGATTDAYAYSPYGVLLSHSGTSTQPFTFIGARGVRMEPAGGPLYQMRARYFDPSTTRFLSPDPVWPDLYRPARLNPYQYAMRSPLRFFDPSGAEEVDLQYVSDDVSVFGYLFSGDWFSSLDDLLAKIKQKLGPNDCIRTLTIVNHGSSGVRGWIQFDSENYVCKNPNGRTPFSSPETEAKLRELQKLFCKDGTVIFRICRAGEGEEGEFVLKAFANILKVRVQGPEGEIKAAPWGGITVPWRTVYPDGWVPPDTSGIASVNGETKAALR